MFHIIVWNGFSQELQILMGTESFAATMAQIYLEDGSDVIYFYAHIASFELTPMG